MHFRCKNLTRKCRRLQYLTWTREWTCIWITRESVRERSELLDKRKNAERNKMKLKNKKKQLFKKGAMGREEWTSRLGNGVIYSERGSLHTDRLLFSECPSVSSQQLQVTRASSQTTVTLSLTNQPDLT